MVGGGGLITVPFLIFMGFTPAEAVANTKLGACGSSLSAIRKYKLEKAIRWDLAPKLAAFTVVGSAIGANLMVAADQELVRSLVGFVILALLPLVVRGNKIGIIETEPSRNRIRAGYLVYFLIQIYGGFLGAGGGILGLYAMMYFFGLPIVIASGTGSPPWFAMSFATSIVYGYAGLIDWAAATALFLGMSAGGQLGATLAVRQGNRWLRNVFATVVVLSALKLIVF